MKTKSKRPKIHTKAIVIDGQQAFIGSANLIGVGLDAKGANKARKSCAPGRIPFPIAAAASIPYPVSLLFEIIAD